VSAKTALFTFVALVAFAANSLLCRMALGPAAIDPASFTSVRLVSGALVLAVLTRRPRTEPRRDGSWRSGLALFAYAICFSFAYVSLNTATGALILFAAVQMTMVGAGLTSGERLRLGQWAGLAMAAGGLVYLLVPGAAAPSLSGALLMTAAGVAWGLYSLRGRGVADPLAITAANFRRSLVPALVGSTLFWQAMSYTPHGLALAAISGAVTSGLGYAIWYTALRGHTAMSAAVVQLAVPVIAV
jgi:drug/metabolite transporter (DMT)-like permease